MIIKKIKDYNNKPLTQTVANPNEEIQVHNLLKKFKDLTAVNNVSFTIKKGEIFGFLGPNGAGKTTTIKAILGHINIDEGTIKIHNKNIKNNYKQAKKYLGYLPEKVAFYNNLTALQNMYFYAEMKQADKKECKTLIEEFGLSQALNKKVGQFSKGMTQRLGMARAILGNPPIIILDEPSSGLDPRAVVQIRDKIIELNKKYNTTFFISSHILSEIQAVCHRVGIINKGILVAEDTIESLGKKLNLKPKMMIELEKITDEILKTVKKLKGVDSVTKSENTLIIQCDTKSKAKVIVAIEKAGGTINNFKSAEPSLEEVFMKYTEEQ